MATWTNESKPSGTSIPAGSMIAAGFFMFLTYANTVGATSWTNQSKNSASWTNETKN